MTQTFEKLRNVSSLQELAELVWPSSIATAFAVLVATWYIVSLFNTFIASGLKAIPGSFSELAIPKYNTYKQLTVGLRGRITSAHEKHGSIVRVAPDRISIADPDILQELLKVTDIPKHKGTYQAWMDVNQGDKGMFDNVDMTNVARTMLNAGSETTANTMAWTTYLLVTHPTVFEK
ncbi:hypothetical protein M427DRAFT_39421 [Gonapodya prolifera JEL478]|uniref:Cytochrome P450 n=1 Tax=Gonapodya prolifera (strain JEL478) TaxID=1344416 RepID=A0A138ZXF6_GONPJ|nr:hypothetical protein M427DRAFT_39421 [Gonapodya prolifera JEL478]|eukprot:KXS09169.1 hypothetical protein M427DRAFT_39421 [Gonapodya prolifera JEL478]